MKELQLNDEETALLKSLEEKFRYHEFDAIAHTYYMPDDKEVSRRLQVNGFHVNGSDYCRFHMYANGALKPKEFIDYFKEVLK